MVRTNSHMVRRGFAQIRTAVSAFTGDSRDSRKFALGSHGRNIRTDSHGVARSRTAVARRRTQVARIRTGFAQDSHKIHQNSHIILTDSHRSHL